MSPLARAHYAGSFCIHACSLQTCCTLCRVLRSGGVPALGPAGLAIPNFDPASVRRLTPTASPAAAEIARQRGALTDDDPGTPATMPAALRPPPGAARLGHDDGAAGHGDAAKTPELPRRPQLRPVGASHGTGQQAVQSAQAANTYKSPLDPGGLSELQAVFAKRRQQNGDDAR